MSVVATALSVRVNAKTQEAAGICSFELVSADGKPLPEFTAGSHVDVQVVGGRTRQYSLCNDPAENHRYLIAVLKDSRSRGGSRWMHENIHVGDTLVISTPRNHFPLAENRTSLLLAGGIGVTPILCMAERLSELGGDFAMHYCAQSSGRTAFLQRIAASAYASRVQFHFDEGAANQRLDIPRLLGAQALDTHLYVCGPSGFMEAVLTAARNEGWQEERLHFEFFGAELTKATTNQSFQVKLASSGRVITVAQDQSVIDALAQQGVEIPTSCEQGVCGTCLTRVLDGEPDHRDMYLTSKEQAANNQFLPCCSRSRSPLLVLDL